MQASQKRGRRAALSQLEMPFDDGDAASSEDGPVACLTAVNQPAAPARLEGGELVASEPFHPIGHERSMGGAGHRVLVDPAIGNENAADDVLPISPCSDDRHPVDLAERRE